MSKKMVESKVHRFEKIYEVDRREGTVKVLCIIHRSDLWQDLSYLPVVDVKYHFDTRRNPTTGETLSEELFIDEGYITIEDKQERYLAKGIPPLVYRENNPVEVRWQ